MNDQVTPFIQFYDSMQAALAPGVQYTITVDQTLDGVDTGDYFQTATQAIEVRAPQFTLDATWIHAQFPPPDSSGHFDFNLPHIALSTPILPWERELAPGVPWLALLVFRSGELDGTLITSTVSDLLAQSTTAIKPEIDPQTVPADILAGQCWSILVPGALFADVAPDLADLAYLAHVRQVDPSAQPTVDGPADDGWYSVVVANRFPSVAGGTHSAYLVSLEGFATYLQPGAAAPAQPVQLAVLATWDFTSVPDTGETFGDLAQALAGDAAPLLRIPPPTAPEGASAAQQEAAARLTDGYAPLPYATEFGESTFAWYRGPLTPGVAQPVPKAGPHFTSAAQALIYVEPDGVFDVSYAAAWSLGRALALADAGFASAMLHFRRASRAFVTSLLARLPADLTTPPELAELVAAAPVRAAFDALLTAGLAGSASAAVRAPAPAAPAAPALTDPLPPPVAALEALLAAPDAQAVMAEQLSDELEPIGRWIAQLQLLASVPFAQLVPDARMLPAEALRFFYVDPAWLGALADGALSIGTEGVLDATVAGLLAGVLEDAVRAEAGPAPASGFLLRSALVSGWPSLVVSATAGGAALAPLRLQALAADTLLALYPGVPDTVTLQEPQQGLQFGIEDDGTIALRALSGSVGQSLGKALPFTDAYLRGDGVLAVGPLVAALETAVGVSPLGPADVALQLVLGAEKQAFT